MWSHHLKFLIKPISYFSFYYRNPVQCLYWCCGWLIFKYFYKFCTCVCSTLIFLTVLFLLQKLVLHAIALYILYKVKTIVFCHVIVYDRFRVTYIVLIISVILFMIFLLLLSIKQENSIEYKIIKNEIVLRTKKFFNYPWENVLGKNHLVWY